MACLFFTTLYSGFLGWQWRQTRELGAELSGLRKQLPKEVLFILKRYIDIETSEGAA